MKFNATIYIMPREDILDPQGKATLQGLQNLGYGQVTEVRIGKQIELQLDVENQNVAKTLIEEACKRLLVNPVIEQYNYRLEAG